MFEELSVRLMTKAEVALLVDWAAEEGWNPGLSDAEIFWNTDPEAFIAAEVGKELIGGGAITSYGGYYGFMGFFIIRPEFRNRGYGSRLWQMRRDKMIARLYPGATVGLDGVFEMRDFYARGGFIFSHRNLRFVYSSSSRKVNFHENIVPVDQISFNQLAQYDRTCFPASRDNFLQGWVSQHHSRSVGYMDDGQLEGYGVMRQCRKGFKIGPLFANNQKIAEVIYCNLVNSVAGAEVFLDVPENNPAAMSLVRQFGMKEIFGCARMCLGPVPEIMHDRVYGVTTFELG